MTRTLEQAHVEPEVSGGPGEPLPARVRRCFRALDTLDATSVTAFFAEGAALRLPGIRPIRGSAAIRKALAHLFAAVGELRHESLSLRSGESIVVFQADLKMRLACGMAFSFPATYTMRWNAGLIEEASITIYLESRMTGALWAFDRLQTAG
jgi:SnoaL-like domain